MGYLSTENFTSTATTTLAATLTIPGTADFILIGICGGYQGSDNSSEATSACPASITVGGVTLSLIAERSGNGFGSNDGYAGVYAADAADIASMSGSALAGTLGTNNDWVINVVYYENTDQTAGVVASAVSTFNGSGPELTCTLSHADGDYGILFGGNPGNNGTCTSSNTTSRSTATTGGGATNTNSYAGTTTMTGTSTALGMDTSFNDVAGAVAVAIREDSGGGGTAVPVFTNHLRQQGMS